MIGSAAFLVLGLSLINLWAVVPKVGWEESRAGLEILRYCFDLFWDYNPDKNFRGFLIVDYALIGMRYLYIGLFISVVYKSISHR
ncbi:hypothetical protein ASD67_09010 [Sphingopyxis sp. Root1497]|nr:hypothetical protein ASD67_09010 [Sphingopyxis sp. Root1497]